MIAPDGSYACPRLGLNLDAGDRPQQLVARDQWFAAEPVEPDGFTLAGCTVAPGFDMTDFELAERDALTHAYPAHTELIARLTRTGASP